MAARPAAILIYIYMGAGCSGSGELRTGELEWPGNRDHGNCRHESLSRWPPDLRRGERGNGADQLASWAVSRLAAHVRRVDHGLGHLCDPAGDERRIQNGWRFPAHPGGLFRATDCAAAVWFGYRLGISRLQ